MAICNAHTKTNNLLLIKRIQSEIRIMVNCIYCHIIDIKFLYFYVIKTTLIFNGLEGSI